MGAIAPGAITREVSMSRRGLFQRAAVVILFLCFTMVTAGCASRSASLDTQDNGRTTTETAFQGYDKTASETPASASNPADSTTADRKIIFTATLTVDVGEAEKAFRNAESLAVKWGGFVAQSSLRKGDTQVTAHLTLRVPAAKATQLMNELSALGTVTDRSSGSEDITSTYIDVQARLKVLRAEEEQLTVFLKKATTIKDMLAVEEQLKTVRTEIEQYEGQQRYMDNATSLATVNVDLVQTTGSFVAPRGFWSAFVQSLVRFGHGLAAFWTWLGGSLVFIVFYGLLLGGMIWLALRILRRYRAKGNPGQQ